MKKLIVFLAVLYFILGINFYLQDLRYSRLVVHVAGEAQKLELSNELPNAFYMIFLWPFLIAGKVV